MEFIKFGVTVEDELENKVSVGSNVDLVETGLLTKKSMDDVKSEDVFYVHINNQFSDALAGLSVEGAKALVEELNKGIEFVEKVNK
jgi:hypothetical protein